MSDELYFKSKRRDLKVVPTEKYVPEYQRLGKEPIQYPKDARLEELQQAKIKEQVLRKQFQLSEELTEKPAEIESKPLETEEEVEFSFEKLENNAYVLLYEDSVLQVGTIEEVKESLNNILLDIDSDKNIEKFSILKKVTFTFGVIIE